MFGETEPNEMLYICVCFEWSPGYRRGFLRCTYIYARCAKRVISGRRRYRLARKEECAPSASMVEHGMHGGSTIVRHDDDDRAC